MVWGWLALVHLGYYTQRWSRERRQLQEAEEQAELERRMRQPVPDGTSGPWRWDITMNCWVPVLPQVPAGPAPGAVSPLGRHARCDAYAVGCQCGQCVARAERDRRTFCEEYSDPGLMDTLL
jgi:hypothetical protein